MDMTLAGWDWLVIGVYFTFIIGIGFLCKHINKNSDDYFRGGGNMLWWLAGMSAIAVNMSTWTFTAGAAKVYRNGILLPVAWLVGAPLFAVVGWYVAPRFRKMRVITSIEGVFRRFGLGTEQFFVYLTLPMTLVMTGFAINTVAVFFGAALGISVPVAMVGMFSIVTVMSVLGGQWAVVASDFVQGLLMLLTVTVVVVLSVNLPEIGGFSNLPSAIPDHLLRLDGTSRLSISLGWLFFIQMIYLFSMLNVNGEGAKYLLVKDGRGARRMVLMRFVLFGVIPLNVLALLPALLATTVFPDIGAVMTQMKKPEEGAFLAMAFKTLPQGMMGLLICGMFAAAMSSLDTALNRNAGYFVKNVYIKYINKDASEERQLYLGRVFTLIFSAVCLLIGLSVDKLRTVNLFDLFQIVNSMVWIPSMVPIALGIVYKKTPGWSGWSTVLVGLATGAVAKMIYSPALFEKLIGGGPVLTAKELPDAQFIFISALVFAVTIGWFFFTSIFYKKSSAAYRERVDRLFADLNTPINHREEDSRNQQAMQYRLVGLITLLMGACVALGIFIPGGVTGRVCFASISIITLAIGALLYLISIKKYKEDPSLER